MVNCQAIIRLLLLSFFLSAPAWSAGYQMDFNGGVDTPNKGQTRKTANFIQGQLATLTKFFRLESTFTALSGSSYIEGEGGIGIAIYPVSQFVSERAKIHPFLIALGTAGVGSLNEESRLDTGYGFGAGMDLKLWQRSGFSFSIQQHNAKEKTLRYSAGLFWERSE